METMLDRLRELVQTETVIGKPVEAGNVTLIPISRVSIGFGGGGGGDRKNAGGGGGVRVEPIGFVIITDGKAQILPVKAEDPALYKLVDILPDVWDTVRSFMGKESDEDASNTDEPSAEESTE
jgi:uncharacterized spore protein YtfJ